MIDYTRQFIKYTLYGTGAAVIDISILWTSVELFGVHYVIGTIVAFIAATFVNYVVFRKYVFKGSDRNFHTGYICFLSLAGLGMALTVGCMVFFIEVLDTNILFARVVTAIIVGLWNFSMNYFINFRMHDKKPASGGNEEIDI